MSAGRLFWVQRDGAVVEVPLTKAKITIGRTSSSDLRIASPAISSRHAQIMVSASSTVLEDLGSTNGTRVNGRRIESLPLKHGDQIEVGNERLVFFADATQTPAQLGREVQAIAKRNPGGSEFPELPTGRKDWGSVTQPFDGIVTHRTPSSRPRLKASIVVMGGNLNGKRFPLTKSVTTLGQDGMQVFQVTLVDGEYWAQRGPSSTAPYVNGVAVDDKGCKLTHKDVIELGGAAVRFEIDAE
jgi:FHA domain